MLPCLGSVCRCLCVCVCVCFVVFDGRCKLLLQLSPRARGSLPEKSKDIYRTKRKREKQGPQKCSRGLHARSRGLSGMFFPAPKNFPSGTVQNDCPEYIYVSKLATMDKGGYVGPEIRVVLISLRPDHTPCILVMHLFRPETGSCATSAVQASRPASWISRQHMPKQANYT